MRGWVVTVAHHTGDGPGWSKDCRLAASRGFVESEGHVGGPRSLHRLLNEALADLLAQEEQAEAEQPPAVES